ncbi:MAG: hypothetical protein JSV13_08355 [Nitrospiraceae bacterium]|jgi:hypothetical protein|nr:MAG: hypothetical protein JSV13_08355 [Nitrospiraceae bacterium]
MISFSNENQADELARSPAGHFFRIFIMVVLIIIVMVEGYYAFVLNNKIREQRELTKQISLELQNLKNERDQLNEDLHKYRTLTGENLDGNTHKR